VVAFVHPVNGRLVVHRVIGYGKNACLIQGDNIWGLVDGQIPHANILGRVTSVERRGRMVRLGLGPERFILALLSRTRLLKLVLGSWTVVRSSFQPRRGAADERQGAGKGKGKGEVRSAKSEVRTFVVRRSSFVVRHSSASASASTSSDQRVSAAEDER
jgi:hypothetical protein